MTEMIVNFRIQPRLFKGSPALNRIDPIAFAGSLVLAPFVFALFTFWLLLVPVFAIPYGAVPYLILGTPSLIWALGYRRWVPFQIAMFGLAVNIAAFWIGAALTNSSLGSLYDYSYVQFFFGFGCIFAPAWAYTFAKLYSHFKRF